MFRFFGFVVFIVFNIFPLFFGLTVYANTPVYVATEAPQLDTLITRDTLSICQGDSTEIFGTWVNNPDNYSATYESTNGLDSTHITTLWVQDTFHTYEHISLCAGHFIKVGHQIIHTGGTYTLELNAENGCDSLHTMIVTVIDTIFTRDTIAICQYDSLEIDDTVFYQSGDYASTYVAQSGCDSTHITHVRVLDALETQEVIMICAGETVDVFGTLQTASGTFLDTLQAHSGCDSIHQIELRVLDSLSVTLEGDFACMMMDKAWVNASVIGGFPPYNYQWNMTNDNTAMLQNMSAGQHQVTVTDAYGCAATATISLVFEEIEQIEVEVLNVSCFGEKDGEITIQALRPHLQFSLDGLHYQKTTVFSNLTAGIYTLYTLDNNNCVDEQAVEITQPNEIFIQLPADTTLSIGHTIQLYPLSNVPLIEHYEWTTTTYLNCSSCPNPLATPLENMSYELTITDDKGCTATDMINIWVDNAPRVYIPNAFSPNGDGENDVFMIFTNPVVSEVRSLKLFDRWGEVMYEAAHFPPNEAQYGWDGYFRGDLMSNGVYAYYAEVELLNGQTLFYKGGVSLIR